MVIKLTFLLLFVACWIIGGQWKGRVRDVPCPLLIALCCAISLKTWWLFIALSATYQIIRAGYGNYEDGEKNSSIASILAFLGLKDYKGWYVRGVWGLLVGSIGACALLGALSSFQYISYALITTLFSFLASRLKLNVYLADTVVALSVASIIFMV